MTKALFAGWVMPTIVVLSVGCGKDEPEPLPEQPWLDPGAACDPDRLPAADTPDPEDDKDPQPVCAPGLACEPLASGDGFVCGAELAIVGRVSDAFTGLGVEAARVVAFNANGEPVTDVVVSDACGDYHLPISRPREPNGDYVGGDLKWTLGVSARDYQPFPTGLRPALPIDIADAAPDPSFAADPPEDGEKKYAASLIDNAATRVALISLGADPPGVTVAGTLGPSGAGALVVAEGAEAPAPYGVADASGGYTLFNVPAGATTVRAYRQGLAVTPAGVTVGTADMAMVDLAVTSTDPAGLASVTGSLNIVNAPGGSVTSVVLVPASVYNEALERGPVPLGLRDPPPPAAPDVDGSFALAGVPDGTYKVLVAFENDLLVRDPDPNIAGTQIQEITVAGGAAVAVADGFKVTEALAIRGPGVDGPEEVEGGPTFMWADDSSEEGYTVVVYDALGSQVWTTDVASGNGGDVSVAYGGPSLKAGMYYQFRVTSWREQMGERSSISRTEDLRGVFYSGEAPPLPECTVEEETGGETGGSSDGG